LFSSCTAIGLAGSAVVLTGKAAVTGVKVGTAVVGTTARATGATIRYFAGKHTVKLEREGNSLFANVRLNRRHKARLLLDTGASSLQISPRLARQLGLDLSKADLVSCTLANGTTTVARSVVLKEVTLGKAGVKKVSALVLDAGAGADGLLGMSFLNHFNFRIDTTRDLLVLECK
jgi:clan AA aspartic protease (TIGR02281 family)